MSSMTNWLAAGAVAFLAYCIYFDHKRRSDPNFKAKLKEKRLKAKSSKRSANESDIPIFGDPAEMQSYFLKEVQASDELMINGQFEEAAFHLANAAVVCHQKNEFLAVMQKTLPPPIFQLLIQNYQAANELYLKKIMLSGTLNNPSSKPSAPVEKPQFDDTDIE